MRLFTVINSFISIIIIIQENRINKILSADLKFIVRLHITFKLIKFKTVYQNLLLFLKNLFCDSSIDFMFFDKIWFKFIKFDKVEKCRK